MANYSSLLNSITSVIKANPGNDPITGPELQTVLQQMVVSMGQAGYIYKGRAYPGPSPAATDPGNPDQNVFYIATTPGTYTNFSSIVVAAGECAILKGSGTSWSKEATGIDLVSVSQNNLTGHTDITVGSTTTPVASVEEVSQLGQKEDALLVWDTRSLVYSDTAPSAVVVNVYNSLKYVYAPDITDDVYVTFYKYTTSDGAVNLGRIRLSKVSDGSQVFINYSNPSIEQISGGLWDGCYKCWLDSTKYIIVDPVLAQAESTLTTKHFILNPTVAKFEQEDTKIANNAASILSLQNTTVKDRLWDASSKIYQVTMPNETSSSYLTLTRAYNMIKDYNLFLTETCWVYFFQVSHSGGAITNVRIRLHKVSDGSQVFINYTMTKIEQITSGKYNGCYKCYVDAYRYIIIDDLYSSIATVEFNDGGTDKWLIVKNTISDEIRICASNSSLKGSPDFDFYCDGYDDNAEIEYALGLIPKGGKIKFSDGLFNIGTVQDGLGYALNRSTCKGISFAGQGRGVTTLKLQPSGLLVDGKDLSGYYGSATFTFNADNQPTVWNGGYRVLKCAVFDALSSLSSYTITINGTDKDGNSVSASANRTSATTFARLWFGNTAFKTIDSIVFSGVTFSREPGLLRFCLAYANSENNIFRFSSLDNILIEDMALDGNYENEELAYLSTDSIKNGISLTNCKNVTLRNIESSNFFYHGVIGVVCENVHQTNCILSGNGHRATHYHDVSKNIIFEGNFCKDNGRNHGRNLDPGTSGVFIMYSNNDCIVKNNTIEGDDYCALDIQQEITDNNSYGRVIISGNICHSTYSTSIGIQVLTNRTAEHISGALDSLLVADNLIETEASGILMTNAAIKNMVVKGNIVKMGSSGYLALGIQGVAADAVNGLAVTGNVISGGNSVIVSNVVNAAVVGNVFDAANVSISGNNIVNDNNIQLQ